jgi:hypothetical protein
MLAKRIMSIGRDIRDYQRLPEAAKTEDRRDKKEGPGPDPGIDRAVEESLGWLCRAQDNSTSSDGGVARHYSLIKRLGCVLSGNDRLYHSNRHKLR